MADFTAAQADLAVALEGVLRKHEVSMVTGWVVGIEVIDEDGRRGLWQMAPLGQASWTSKGYLAEMMDNEKAAAYKAWGESDGD